MHERRQEDDEASKNHWMGKRVACLAIVALAVGSAFAQIRQEQRRQSSDEQSQSDPQYSFQVRRRIELRASNPSNAATIPAARSASLAARRSSRNNATSRPASATSSSRDASKRANRHGHLPAATNSAATSNSATRNVVSPGRSPIGPAGRARREHLLPRRARRHGDPRPPRLGSRADGPGARRHHHASQRPGRCSRSGS